MPLNKAPGSDGYTTEFFKSAWPIIGLDVVAAIQAFFVTGFLPKGINSTILTLVPKKDNVTSMKDYRPISCCNVIYKIITKILANRLKALLPEIIVSNQSAFVKGRLLLENVLLASELVKDYHKQNISPRSAMKIDIAKAFDSVQWEFLLKTLEALQFPATFIRWIGICISSASFSVQINGEKAGYFGSSRGLRQGCPLSPYLFVLCMNVLSHMIDAKGNSQRLSYHPKCKNIKLTHLCFADDILVFVDGKKRSIEEALNVFGEFAEISGLQVSLDKSTLYSAGVQPEVIEAIRTSYRITPGKLPIRYLGLPLMTKRMQRQDYQPLIERIKAKVRSWTGRLLSYSGRLQLLTSVISSLINFWISAFILPKRCIKEINSICSAFLWSGPDLNSHKAKLPWAEICKPKEEGGIGIKDIHLANKVSSLKIIWRLLSVKSLWADWIAAYIIRKGSFWAVEYTTAKGSWIMRKLLKLRPVAKSHHRIRIGNGESTSFWYDSWSTLGCLFNLTGPRGAIDLGITLTATVAEAKRILRLRPLRNDILNQIMVTTHSVFEHLQPNVSDKHQWRLHNDTFSNRFFTKQTCHLIRQHSDQTIWHKGIWFKHATPKYSFLAWLAVNNRLSTGDRIQKWAPRSQIQCIFCGCILESRNHLFFICRFSEAIWRQTLGNLIPHFFTQDWDMIINLTTQGVTSATTTFLLRYAFQTTVYHVWRERNARRHGKQPSTPTLLNRLIDKNIRNRISSLTPQQRIKLGGALEEWFASRM